MSITDDRDEISDGARELNGNDGEYDVALSDGGAVDPEGMEQ